MRFAEGRNVRSIGKQFGESVESAVKKKGKATVEGLQKRITFSLE